MVRYRFEGAWSVRQFIDVRRQATARLGLTRVSALLFDLRRTTAAPKIRDLQAALRESSNRSLCRAYLVNSRAQYDVAHELQALLGPQSVVSEVFDDESKALEWLAAIAVRRARHH